MYIFLIAYQTLISFNIVVVIDKSYILRKINIKFDLLSFDACNYMLPFIKKYI